MLTKIIIGFIMMAIMFTLVLAGRGIVKGEGTKFLRFFLLNGV